MSSWIQVRTNLHTHPKLVKLAHVLGVTRTCAWGLCVHVWSLADEHTTNGHMMGWDVCSLDTQLEVPGACKALIEIGWLAQDRKKGLYLPRFEKYNGESNKARIQEAQRKEKYVLARRAQLELEVSAQNARKTRGRKEKKRELRTPLPPRGGAHTVREHTISPSGEPVGTTPALRSPRPGSPDGAGAPELPGFAKFWARYPGRRKAAARQCLAKWENLGCEARAGEIIAGLERWIVSEDWEREQGRYIPAPLVWLNQTRWTASPPPAAGKKALNPEEAELALAGWEAFKRLDRASRQLAIEAYRAEVLRGSQVTYAIEDAPKFRVWLGRRERVPGVASSPT